MLTPVLFDDIYVERMKQDLSSPTDIEVSIKLGNVSIMAGSVLELRVPKDKLDLDGEGIGKCMLTT